jgi:nucleoid DNA-binding protein
MEELLKNVQEKTGLSMDQAKSAISAVLGFIRGKLPEQAAGQFDTAIAGLGQTGKLPAGLTDLSALAEKTGLAGGQVGSLVETVMTFLKDKLPADVVNQITTAMSSGMLAGIGKKVAALFGK